MTSTASAGSAGHSSAKGARPRGAGCALLSPAVVYGDGEPLPELLVLAILEAWKNRAQA